MRTAAGVAFVIVAAVLLAGPSWETTLRDDLHDVGCRNVLLDHQRGPASVLSISARECIGLGGALLGADDAIEIMADVAWASPGPPFTSLYVAVYRSADAPTVLRLDGSQFTREQLAARWGPRPAELDQNDGFRRAWGDLLWIMLPIGYLVVISAVVLAVVGIGRRGWTGLIWIRC